MTISPQIDVESGARNLLERCGEFAAGDRILIVQEDPSLGWYDADVPAAILTAARSSGLAPEVINVGGPPDPLPPGLDAAINAADGIVYCARLGDQDRFGERHVTKPAVMCYARTAEMLGGAYGQADYRAFVALKQVINDLTFGAEDIAITCRLGTDLRGSVAADAQGAEGEVTVRRFPLGVPQPIPAESFSGRVALARALTPTGSQFYRPAALYWDGVVFAIVENGKIAGFEGDAGSVRAIEAHYAKIADQFEIDKDVVHSWHAGIHPGLRYTSRIEDDPDRWSNTVFTNPRFLHFHTCGAYAPGEICWMVLDPTISVGGVPLWQEGRLNFESVPAFQGILKKWSDLAPIFETPSRDVGADGWPFAV